MITRIIAAKACPKGHTWGEIARHLGQEREAIRSRYRRVKKQRPQLEGGPCPLCTEPAAEESGTRWEENGNTATASATGERIQTLDQLIAAAEIDLTTWQIVDWGVKKWEVGAKIKRGQIHWRDGGIDHGDLIYEGLGIQDLWSVWAKLIRRQPIAIAPVIQPVTCGQVYKVEPITQDPGALRLALIIPDVHLGYRRDNRTGQLDPFHDRQVLDLAIQLAEHLQPDEIEIIGDYLDLTLWTDRFAREPAFYWTTQPAILEGHYILRALREAAPNAAIDLFEGNHEARMRKAIEAHLMEAYQLRAADEIDLPPALSVERLLALQELGIGWIGDYPEGERWLGILRLEHGSIARQPPGATARAVAEDTDINTAFGHTHRIERVSRKVRSAHGWRTVQAISFGTCARIDSMVPGNNAGQNWQQGIGIVEYDNFQFTATALHIEDGRTIYQGRTWQGRDYTGQLEEAIPGWKW